LLSQWKAFGLKDPKNPPTYQKPELLKLFCENKKREARRNFPKVVINI